MGTSYYSLNLIRNKGVGGTGYFIDTPSWGPCYCSGFFTSNPGVVIKHKKLFSSPLNEIPRPLQCFHPSLFTRKLMSPSPLICLLGRLFAGVHIYFINIRISTFFPFCCCKNFTLPLLNTIW